MALRTKLSFTTISTALLLSTVAFPVSAIAFAVLYADNDSFWPNVWLGALLPAIWVAVAALVMRDAFKRRSRRQMVGVVALLVSMALLFGTSLSARFWEHQLFTFRPLRKEPLPPFTFSLVQRFDLCEQKTPCVPRRAVTESQSFKLAKVPDECCSLAVVNGKGGKYRVQSFRVFLNGNEIKMPTDNSPLIASVTLRTENEITVQLTGPPDAYIHLIYIYIGKKDLQLPKHAQRALPINP